MPSVNSVGSLLQLSVAHIVTRIEHLDTPANSTTNSRELKNLFHQLPSSLLEQVIVYPKNGKPTEAFVLECLISTHIRFARFHVYSERYLTVFPRFEKLISLVLRFSEAGNSCLLQLGIHCKNLRILDVYQCRSITDTGVRMLCSNFDNNNYVLKPTALCNTLQHLTMYYTSVTKRGIRFAIDNLTALKNLYHVTTFEVVLEIVQTGRYLMQDSFSYVHLSLDDFTYIQGSLGQVVQFVPSLTCVVICVTNGLTDADLLSLMSLRNLRTFRLDHFLEFEARNQEFEITFKGGVVPILRKLGNYLESLDMSFFPVIDIWTVFKFCPNLILFWFKSHCDSVTVLSESEIALYLNNENERLISKNLCGLCCGYNTSPKILHFLLSFPVLKDIHIKACDALTDVFLQSAVSCHMFKNVKNFNLSFCHYVTKRGMDALMTNLNCVEEIRIKYCDNLTHDNVHEWHLQAKKNNWKLNIHFKDSDYDKYYCSNTKDYSLKYV